MTSFRQKRGQKGEHYALQYLQKKGYRLVARNVRYPFGELDLVCIHPRRGLVIVEVRSLDRRTKIHPLHTLTASKFRRLKHAITAFLQQNPIYSNYPIHLDAIGILWEKGKPVRLEHVEDAFGYS